MKVKLFLGFFVSILYIFIFSGCVTVKLVNLETHTVTGPAYVRQGEDINPKDITVWGIYEDGQRKVVSLSRSNIIFNKSIPGRQTVRIRVGGQEASFETDVVALRALIVSSPPRTTIYKQGQEPDQRWPGLEIRGDWVQLGQYPIPVSSCTITGYMKDQPGRQTIRVAYEGLTATFDVDVRGMSSLQIIQAPTKIDYLQGESLNLTGLRVTGVWGDPFPNENLSITMSDITGYNPNNVGIQHVTITKNGRSASFDVEVLGLTSLEIDKPPTKTNYIAGEQLNLAGIMVYGNYTGANPTKRKRELIPIDQLVVSGYEPNRIGDQQRITVTVRGISANFFVNISAAPAPAPTPTPTQPPAQGGNQGGNQRPGQGGQQPTQPAPTPLPSQPPAQGGNQGGNQSPGQGGQQPSQPAQQITVTITPANPTVAVGSPLQLSAAVAGTTNRNVTWSVGSNPDATGSVGNGTSINRNGRLTISANEQNTTLYVKAVSAADSAKFAIIAVTVIPKS